MSDWSFDISAAPRGEWVSITETRKGKDGETKLVESREYRHEWVWLYTKCFKKVRTRWLPPSQFTPSGRWDGLSANEAPIAWHPYIIPADPVMPKVAA
jgi:hypothetical protein